MKANQGLGRSLILLNFVLFIQANGQISNIQRCGDPQCQGKTKFWSYIHFLTLYNWQLFLTTTFLVTGPISEGRTLLKYHANSNSMLSFTNNQPVLIFSKGDGTQTDIWGVEVIKKVNQYRYFLVVKFFENAAIFYYYCEKLRVKCLFLHNHLY